MKQNFYLILTFQINYVLKSHPWTHHKEVEVLSMLTGDWIENLLMKDEASNCRELLGYMESRRHREVRDKHGITEYWSKKSSNMPNKKEGKWKMRQFPINRDRHLDMADSTNVTCLDFNKSFNSDSSDNFFHRDRRWMQS